MNEQEPAKSDDFFGTPKEDNTDAQRTYPMTVGQVVGQTVYAGRNQRCPCGSGLKYKKCHRTYQMG